MQVASKLHHMCCWVCLQAGDPGKHLCLLQVNLASIPLSAGDLLLLDNRAWRRLRSSDVKSFLSCMGLQVVGKVGQGMHTHGFSGRCLLLVYEYTTTSAESLSSAPDATYWSAAAWLLRLRRAAGALRATLPWHET